MGDCIEKCDLQAAFNRSTKYQGNEKANTVYVEDILFPVIKQDSMLTLEVDIFSLGDEDEIRADKALSEQVQKYLELGNFDKNGNFIPLPSNDDYHFPFEEEMQTVSREHNDEILERELISFLGDCASSKERLEEAVKKFVMRTHWYSPGMFCGVYHASSDVINQLERSIHFQLVPAGALFLKFGDMVMMLTIGIED